MRRWIFCGLIAFWTHEAFCQIKPLTFSGSQATDGWVIDFNSYSQTIFGTFPGTNTWLQPMIANVNVSGSQRGALTKVTNGLGGGPYPGDHLYFGGYSTNTNTFGGTIKISVPPLSSVKKVVLQVQICQAFGCDFYVPYGAPALTINSISPSALPAVTRTQHELIDPGGLSSADEYLNTYRYEWDVTSVQEVIGSIDIQMSVVQHGQIYALQVDQGSVVTNPAYPPSLKILSIGPVVYQDNVSSLAVTFEGEPAKAYLLEYNETLATSGWSDGESVSTSTGIFSHTFRASGDHRIAWQRQLFFRARWP